MGHKRGSLLRGYEEPFRRFSHSALVIGEDGTIAEALVTGVKQCHLSKYEKGDYVVGRTDVVEHDQEQVLRSARPVLDEKHGYGFVTFLGLALYCLTGAQLCIQQAGTSICSGFVCDALTRAGFIWKRPPFAMMPTDLAQHFDVRGEPGG